MSKYTLTLTCSADSPEELLTLLDFKKKDLYPLQISLEQIKNTLENTAHLPVVTLAGKSGAVKYVVEAGRGGEGPRVTEPQSFTVPCPMPPGMEVRCKGDDKPEDCQADGTGGHCGGLNKCDSTGVCAKGKTDD